jgi:hypothetical protein
MHCTPDLFHTMYPLHASYAVLCTPYPARL